ncbi:MAG: M23 family metallopeptidase [Patescibacteria group bacterium]
MIAMASASLSMSLMAIILSTLQFHQPVQDSFIWPLDAYHKRAIKLTFGLFVTPDSPNNPIVPPERFSGYHAALDIEIYPDEIKKRVPVYASCNGKVIYTGYVNGYGGVIIHTCMVNNQDVTVLYGHLDPSAYLIKKSDYVKAGDEIGKLADHKTHDSGYNRKHLHLQIHRGTNIVLRGYVSRPEDLNSYIDPQTVLPK